MARGLAPAALAEPARRGARHGASAWRRPRARSRSAPTPTWRSLDPAATWTVAREELLDRHRLSPFAGRVLRGRVVRTILRGRTIARDGRTSASPAGAWWRRGA